MFSADAIINDDLLRQAIDRGHSRVPVYEGTRQVGQRSRHSAALTARWGVETCLWELLLATRPGAGE